MAFNREIVMGAQTRKMLGMTALGTAMAAMVMVQTPARADSSGMIAFHGAVVSPQYDIQIARVGSQPATGAASVARDSSMVKVTFGSLHADTPGADVAFYANDAQHSSVGPEARNDVTTHFADPSGQPLAWNSSGFYHLQSKGGVLSMSLKRGDAAAVQKPVTILVSYD